MSRRSTRACSNWVGPMDATSGSIIDGDSGGYGTDLGTVSLNVRVHPGVPEPSTWAIMLIGFAGLGFAAYRRTRKAVSAAA